MHFQARLKKDETQKRFRWLIAFKVQLEREVELEVYPQEDARAHRIVDWH